MYRSVRVRVKGWVRAGLGARVRLGLGIELKAGLGSAFGVSSRTVNVTMDRNTLMTFWTTPRP